MVFPLSTSTFASTVRSRSNTASIHKNQLSSISPNNPSTITNSNSSPSTTLISYHSINRWLSTLFIPSTDNTYKKQAKVQQQQQHKVSQRNDEGGVNIWIKTGIRLLGMSSGIFGMYIIPRLEGSGSKSGFGRGTQYLTIVTLMLSIVNLAMGIVIDHFKVKRLQRIRDAMLPVITAGEITVAVLYWYLTLSNIYNIYPTGVRYMPLWIDLQVHGFPCIFVTLEMFYFSETFTVRRVADFLNTLTYALFYMGWASLCAHMDEEWPYPVLQNIECSWTRLYFMASSIVVYLVFQVLISEVHIRSRASKTLE